MEKAGHRRLPVPPPALGLALLLGLVISAGPAAASRGAELGTDTAVARAGAFEGEPDVSDFVALAVILGLSALRRYLRA